MCPGLHRPIATKGHKTTNGSRVTANNVTNYESTLTQRLNDAGAVMIDKLKRIGSVSGVAG